MTDRSPHSLASPPGKLEAGVSKILETTFNAVPDDSCVPPVLILTIGLPGSGKSTFCRRLAPLIDAVILESDAIRRHQFGEPSYSAAESRRLFAALHATARELLLRGRHVIIDATSIKESDRRPVYELGNQTGARLLQLSFSAPPHVIEQRLARRGETPDPVDSSSAGMTVYKRMTALAERPSREHWEIDTSNATSTNAALNRVVEACRYSAGRAMGGIR